MNFVKLNKLMKVSGKKIMVNNTPTKKANIAMAINLRDLSFFGE